MRRQIIILTVLLIAAWLLAGVPHAPGPIGQVARAEQAPPPEPLVIVVNRSNSVEGVSFSELRRIFLGERSHWANDRRITLVMREPGEPERKTILRDVCGMTEDQLKTHFLHGLFTGEI